MDLLESSEFATRVDKALDDWHVPGVAIALVHGDKVTSRGFGYASKEKQTPVTPDTLFNIASCSKAFTAGLVGLMVADDQYPDVEWNATMSKLLPGEFVMADKYYTENIILDDIISHRTGLGRHDRSILGPRSALPDSPKTITNNLRHLEITAPLRTNFEYNNLMFGAAAYLHERVSGLPLSQALHDKIFHPLNMNSSFLHASSVPSQLHDRKAIGYSWLEDKARYQVMEEVDQPEGDGAGCIITCVNDHIKWVNAMIKHDSVITPEIYKELVRHRTIDNSEENTFRPFSSPDVYAAGWFVRWYRGYEFVFHDGCDVGFGSTQFFLPGIKFGGVIHGNCEFAPYLCMVLAYELIDQALGIPQSERPDWNKILMDERDEDDGDDEDTKALKDASHDQPQTRPLSSYVGTYWDPGYKTMKVEIKDDQLFVDANDRGYPFEMTFEHMSGQSNYRVRLRQTDTGFVEVTRAKFEFESENKAKLGLTLDDRMIWFVRKEN